MTIFHKGQTRILTALLLIGVILLSGCGYMKKRKAKAKIDEVSQSAQEILTTQQASVYLPDLWGNLQRSINDANAAYNNGSADEALSLAEAASSQLDQIRSQLPRVKATIEERKATLLQIQGEVTTVVERVKSLDPAQTGLIEKQTAFENLINQIQTAPVQRADGEQGYDAVIVQAKSFLDEATTTLQNLEKDIAQKQVDELRRKWSEAQSLDVERFVPEAADIPVQIEEASVLIASASYRAVIDRFVSIPGLIDGYIRRAKEGRANARIEEAERMISIAEQNPAASLENIDKSKSIIDAARQALLEDKYDEAFQNAESAIATSRSDVQTYESDLNAQITELEARMEESLQWKTDKIATEKYQEALAQLKLAKDHLKSFLFDEVEADIDRGARVIEEAISEARTSDSKQRLAKSLSDLEATREKGTFDYLREDYQTIQAKIEDIQSLIDRAFYDEADTSLSEVDEAIRTLEPKLRELAQNKLSAAEAQFEEASQAGGTKYAPEVTAEAEELLSKARANAAAAEWKATLENSGKAETLAREAASISYKARADEILPSVREELEKSKLAGASEYAAEAYNQALDAFSKYQSFTETKDYKSAIEKLNEAQKMSGQARKHLIEKAQQFIQSAIDAKSPDYEAETVSQALSDLAASREKMESADYATSRQLAESAIQKAQKAENNTWNKRASAAIEFLSTRVAEAERGRAATYAKEEYTVVTATLDQARRAYEQGEYRSAYESADRGKGEAEKVFIRLADEARLARNEYDEKVDQLKSFVMEQDPFGLDLHTQAVQVIGQLDEALLKNDFPVLFTMYEQGMQTVENQISALKVHNINALKEKLSQSVSSNEQQGLFQFVPSKATEIQAGLTKIEYDPSLDRLKPEMNHYQTVLREILKVESDLGRLKETANANIETRLQKVRTDIDNSREIGARDLVPQVFDSAVDSYEKAMGLFYLLKNQGPGSEKASYSTFGSLLTQAESNANSLNQSAIGRRNIDAYLRNLILWTYDMTQFMDRWYPVEEMGLQMIMTADSSTAADVYKQMQTRISAQQLLTEAERLYNRLEPISPPTEMASLHELAKASFKEFVKSSDGFYRYGLYTRYPKRVRDRFLAGAFASLERLHQNNDRLLMAILHEVQTYNLVDFERELSEELKAFRTYLRRDKNAG